MSGVGLPELPVLEDEAELVAIESPRAVLVTGAASPLGRALCSAWADRYELIRMDHPAVTDDDPGLILADLSVWNESWTAYFDEADTVVHLAGTTHSDASWEAIIRLDLDVVTNVLLASAQAGVDRVVFAGLRRQLGSTDPLGLARLAGEHVGRGFAAAFGLSFVAVRLGSTPPEPSDELVRLFTLAIELELDEGAFIVMPE